MLSIVTKKNIQIIDIALIILTDILKHAYNHLIYWHNYEQVRKEKKSPIFRDYNVYVIKFQTEWNFAKPMPCAQKIGDQNTNSFGCRVIRLSLLLLLSLRINKFGCVGYIFTENWASPLIISSSEFIYSVKVLTKCNSHFVYALPL